jgi:superfamily II DNA/RNA helicase
MEKKHISPDAIRSVMGFVSWNPMQEKMLATFPEKKDIILLSPTGSGKTLGFLLPLLSRLSTSSNHIQALILAPSRELALQIEAVFKGMKTPFKVNCFYGGHAFRMEKNSLTAPPAVLIGTPGRIADHLEKGTFDPHFIQTIIFDEFDKSLEYGFSKEMEYILKALSGIDKRVLTSATRAIEVPDFVALRQPITINFLEKVNTSAGLKVKIVHSEDNDKLDVLYDLLHTFENEPSIVFCNHRDAVDRIAGHLQRFKIVCETFHGKLDQDERECALFKFKNGSSNVLVTTDLAARGLDISSIKHIVHYQMPLSEEAFVHRNGRTARMGKEGTAYLLMNKVDKKPTYIPHTTSTWNAPTQHSEIPAPSWRTIKIGRGKKDKVSKIDVVGLLTKVGQLHKEQVGLIEVKDFYCLVAVESSAAATVLKRLQGAKIKNINTKVGVV